MQIQPGWGPIESQQNMDGLKSGLKRLLKKAIELDPVSRMVFKVDKAKAEAAAAEAAAAAAAQPVPEMPAMPAEAVPTIAPAVPQAQTLVTGGGGTSYPRPLPDPYEDGPPQPVQQAGMFSLNPTTLMVAAGVGLVALLIFGRPQLPGPMPRYSAPRRRRRR